MGDSGINGDSRRVMTDRTTVKKTKLNSSFGCTCTYYITILRALLPQVVRLFTALELQVFPLPVTRLTGANCGRWGTGHERPGSDRPRRNRNTDPNATCLSRHRGGAPSGRVFRT